MGGGRARTEIFAIETDENVRSLLCQSEEGKGVDRSMFLWDLSQTKQFILLTFTYLLFMHLQLK